MVLGKEDTIAPILSKVYTGSQHTSSSVNLGINPYPLSILSAQFTFLPLTQLHTIRNLIPVARFNVPMTHSPTNGADPPSDTLSESVARVAGFIAAGDTYSSLKPELLRIIRESGKPDADSELRRIELKSHQKWMGMDIPETRERTDSVVSDFESVRRLKSGESAIAKSVSSEGARSVGSVEGYVQVAEKGEAASDKVHLKREVGAWWGKKCAE
jgi:hypothetical protein